MSQLDLNQHNSEQHSLSLSLPQAEGINLEIYTDFILGEMHSQSSHQQHEVQQHTNLCQEPSYSVDINQQVQDNDVVPMTLNIFLSTLRSSIRAIDSKQKIKLDEKICRSRKFCVICQQPINKKSKVYNLKCKHYYHTECLKRWSKNRNNCPLCRQQLK